MRIEIEDALPAKAEAAVATLDRPELFGEALRSLVYRQTTRAPITLGGSDPDATATPRRRSD